MYFTAFDLLAITRAGRLARPMRVTSSHLRAQEFQVRIFGGLQFQNGLGSSRGVTEQVYERVLAQTAAQQGAESWRRGLRAMMRQ
jgi:hypothetical protein